MTTQPIPRLSAFIPSVTEIHLVRLP
jgi:hypothetical protein